MRINARRRQAGVALVIVLWILTLMTLMAGGFATTMRREASVSAALKNNAQAQAVAESGISVALWMVGNEDPEQRWRADGTVYRLLRPDGELRVRILSEAGKVDINAASQVQLGAVLNSAVEDEWEQKRLLNAILDWRDADDDTRTQGAERKQYQRAGLNYAPTNAAFQSLEELQLVLGMNEAIYRRLESWITVYSGANEINVEEADPELLAVIARELKKRNIHDEALLQRLQGEPDRNETETEPGESFTSENRTYTIIAQALLNDEAAAGLEAVVKTQSDAPDQPPFQILDWKTGSPGLSLFDAEKDYRTITLQDEFTYDDRP